MDLKSYTSKWGTFYVPDDTPNCTVAQNMRDGHVYDMGVYKWISQFITPGSTVIDVGVCFGQMSVLFSRLVGEQGRVYSIEANELLIPIIRKNLDENKCDNVELLHRAAWDEHDKLLSFQTREKNNLPVNGFSWGSLGIDPTEESCQRVKSLTIDHLGTILNMSNLSAIKIDAQGADLKVLRGASEVIRKYRPAIAFEVEVYHVPQLGQGRGDALSLIEDLGYGIAEEIGLGNYFILPKYSGER